MIVANVGSRHGQVFALMKVEKTHVREMAMFMDDWTDLGNSIFHGDVAAFSSYLQVDLSEEADCYVSDAEPHLLQAKLSKEEGGLEQLPLDHHLG
jgi:hypothetical protein